MAIVAASARICRFAFAADGLRIILYDSRVMDRCFCWIFVGLTALFLVANTVSAAPDGTTETGVVTLSAENLDGTIHLLETWRYQPGDNLSWARPEIDDTTWESLPAASLEEPPTSGWTGIGWFRLRLRRSPDLQGRILGFGLRQHGASEVYLDGELLVSYGKVSARSDNEVAHWPQTTRLLPIHDTAEHVLAVRYSNAGGIRQPGRRALGFVGFVTDFEDSLEHNYRLLAGRAGRWKLWLGAALAFALLHICLFAFRPQEKDNLYFAMAVTGFAGLVGFEGLGTYESRPLWALILYRAAFASGVVMLLGFASFSGSYFTSRWAWLLRLELFLGGLALAWTLVFGGPAAFYTFAFIVISIMVPGIATIQAEKGQSRILTLGSIVVGLSGTAQILMSLGLFGPTNLEIYPYGMLFLFLTISISLARHLALTHRQLEQQLTQVRELSEQALKQEKRSRQREIERHLLEADNARKTAELDSARKLQLSLLPEQYPRIPGVEVSFSMCPAHEVGGDYYDFVESGGTWTLALGDATGHGLQAGMLAMSTKSLFQTTDGQEDLAEALGRIGRGIDGMRLGRMNMALALIRFEAGRCQITSAGMPPFLHYRAARAAVEEIDLQAPPLGTIQNHGYGVAEVAFEPGDLILGMTDGLPETLDPEDEMLGYPALGPLLVDLADRPVDGILEGFLEAARGWANGRDQEDDLTLFVARRI